MIIRIDPEIAQAIRSLIRPSVQIAPDEVSELLESRRIQVDYEVIRRICAALEAGFHLLLTGPPGTGKTSVARALGELAERKHYSHGSPIFTTATEDWTTFETIGGYMPDPRVEGRVLRFEQGQFLRALRERRWLIIDELNRADIDKAFGPLFSVLSNHPVTLPYLTEEGEHVTVLPEVAPGNSPFRLTSSWRIIGTMNTFDKLSLFKLSYAFQRRFVQINVGLPDNYRDFVSRVCAPYVGDFAGTMGELFSAISQIRELGPAIAIDSARFLARLGTPVRSESIVAMLDGFVAPQCEGLVPEDLRRVGEVLQTVLRDWITVDMNAIELQGVLRYSAVQGEAAAREVNSHQERVAEESGNAGLDSEGDATLGEAET